MKKRTFVIDFLNSVLNSEEKKKVIVKKRDLFFIDIGRLNEIYPPSETGGKGRIILYRKEVIK